MHIYVPCIDAPRTPSGPLQTPGKPILNRKYDPRAFERRAGRLLTLTTTPWRSWESRYWVCNQGFSMVLYLDPRPGGGRDSSDTVWFSAPMSTLRDLQGVSVVVRVRRRPARRWKALGSYFRLSIVSRAFGEVLMVCGAHQCMVHIYALISMILDSSFKNNAIFWRL